MTVNVANVTAAASRAKVSSAGPSFGATLRSEWTKFRSVRSNRIMVMLAIGLSVGISALVALVTGMTIDSWGDGARATYDPVTSSMAGLLFRLILLVTLGVTIVTSEYSSGMIRTTFIVSPNRLRVLAAKGVVIGGVALGVGLITVPGMFLVSQPIFGAYGLETASLTDGDTVRFMLGFAVAQALLYALVAYAIAWTLRGTASAITASFGFLLLPYFLSPLMPAWVQANVLRYFPDIAVDNLAGMLSPGDATYLSPAPALLVVVAWLVAWFAVAAVVLHRRDV